MGCKIESNLFHNSPQEANLEVMIYVNYAIEKTIWVSNIFVYI